MHFVSPLADCVLIHGASFPGSTIVQLSLFCAVRVGLIALCHTRAQISCLYLCTYELCCLNVTAVGRVAQSADIAALKMISIEQYRE